MKTATEYQQLRLMAEAELQREIRRTRRLDVASAWFMGLVAVALTGWLCWLLP